MNVEDKKIDIEELKKSIGELNDDSKTKLYDILEIIKSENSSWLMIYEYINKNNILQIGTLAETRLPSTYLGLCKHAELSAQKFMEEVEEIYIKNMKKGILK